MIKIRRRQPDFVRKAGPHRSKKRRELSRKRKHKKVLTHLA